MQGNGIQQATCIVCRLLTPVRRQLLFLGLWPCQALHAVGALSPQLTPVIRQERSRRVAASAHPGCLQTAGFGVLCINSYEEQTSKKYVGVVVAVTQSLNSETVV